ncbi:MAG: type II toxin-antitoxin system Phd/YefM family antitoxin [Desulfobacterales bacterium]|nr:type II toxin-antitoxin system Phd/YefM family antitoxin [Desulfobacterales bacterium]
MEVSFLDLRKNPGKLLEALKRREGITLSRRGKAVARIVPLNDEKQMNTADHPAFGMWADHSELADPAEAVRHMRKGRFHAL